MKLSLTRSLTDGQITVETTFREFLESIEVHRITETKEDCFLYSPAFYAPGDPREDRFVEGVSFGVIDLDHMDSAAECALLERLGSFPSPWYAYTTFSHQEHGPEDNAYRVLIPFLAPVRGEDWPKFWPKFKAIFEAPSVGLRVDPKCKNASRIYFVPACPSSRRHLATFRSHNLSPTAPPFDPSSLLVQGATVRGVLLPRETPSVVSAVGVGVRVSRGALETLAGRLKRRKLRTGEALSRVLEGLAWADRGERDSILYQMSHDIAREFPSANMLDVSEYFTLSVSALQDPDYSIDLVRDKLLRAQREIQEAQEAKEQAEALDRANRIRSAFVEYGLEREHPYTETEIATFAAMSSVPVEGFTHRWIVQSGASFYLYFAGRYVGPFAEKETGIAARKYLAPSPCELDEKATDGKMRPAALTSLVIRYGTHVRNVVADLNSDVTVLDARESTLIEAPCPLRSLSAKYDPDIDEWLRVMSGDRYELVLDWLSWVTELSQPCAALYLQGASGAGKGLFAKGVARLWTLDGPTTMAQALGSHNEGLLRCPLVFADEKIPESYRGVADTARIREFIQEDSRPLLRKFLGDATMRGATRTIIAANNLNLLHSGESLTPDDVQAIADRIIHIPVTPEAVSYLAARRELTREWVSGDKIARFALWVMETRTREANPPRFLVRAPKGALHLEIGSGTALGGAVSHWLVSALVEPRKLWTGKLLTSSAFRFTYNPDTREVYVSAVALTDNWTAYKTNFPEERATMRAVGLALGAISSRRATYQFHGGKSIVHVIPLETLIFWGEENGFHPDGIIEGASKLPSELQKIVTAQNPSLRGN